MPRPASIDVPYLVGGINKSAPPSQIADHEVVDALNFEYALSETLTVRPGLQQFGVSPPSGAYGNPFFHYGNLYLPVGAQLWRCTGWGGIWTNVTGSMVLPNSPTTWQWSTFIDTTHGLVGIGVNSSDSLVIIPSDGNVPFTFNPTGGPDEFKLVVSFNHRLFAVDATEPNTVYFCALGNGTDWTTTGIAGAGALNIGEAGAGGITGMHVHLGRLYFFKEKEVFVLTPGNPNTDNSLWRVDLVSNNIGCSSPWSIQTILNDLVFMSPHGLVSLRAVEAHGDVAKSVISAKLPNLGLSSLTSSVAVNETTAQAYVSTDDSLWVLHYRNMEKRGPVWTRMFISAGRSAYAFVTAQAVSVVFSVDGTKIWGFNPLATPIWTDPGGVVYPRKVVTKAYSFDTPMIRKHFRRIGLEFDLNSGLYRYLIGAVIDQDQTNLAQFFTGTLPSFISGGSGVAANWDDAGANWDVVFWDDDGTGGDAYTKNDLYLRISKGRGQTLQIIVDCQAGFDDAFAFRSLRIEANPLNRRLISG